MPLVRFLPLDRDVEVSAGTCLLDAAALAGVQLAAPCGGEGVCGECSVKVEAGQVECVARGFLTDEQVHSGWVLACSSRVTGDVTVRLKEDQESSAGEYRIVTEHATEQQALLELQHPRIPEPMVRRYCLQVAPPSVDDPLSDFDRLVMAMGDGCVNQVLGQVADAVETGLPVQCGVPVLQSLAEALRTDPANVVTISVAELSEKGVVDIIRIDNGDMPSRAYGLAIDVGTTTCVVHLVDLRSGHVAGTRSAYNAQRTRGLDIISRINYARSPERLNELQKLVVDTLNGLITELCQTTGVSERELDTAVIAGNTTMIHLLLGMTPEYIRLEPYTPTVNRVPVLYAREIGLAVNPAAHIVFAPGVGSYVGGDITAGLLQTALATDDEEISLFLDFGTNGEVALGNAEWIMACAASAGPAFEGTGISCGMRACAGAIERVRIDPQTRQAQVSVIGGSAPAGVCGSGMVDLLAELWKAGLLDSSGKLEREAFPHLISPVPGSSRNFSYQIVPGGESASGEPISITEQDIMNLLRAKAAVYAACSLMLRSVGLGFHSVERVYVAGGFGRYIDIEKAITAGMLPDLPRESYIYLGNSSLAGAHSMLVSSKARQKAAEIAGRITYLELNTMPTYMDEYTAALFLPHTDASRFPSVR